MRVGSFHYDGWKRRALLWRAVGRFEQEHGRWPRFTELVSATGFSRSATHYYLAWFVKHGALIHATGYEMPFRIAPGVTYFEGRVWKRVL